MAAANMNIASTGIVLEALRKDNYENWSTLVKNYLVGQDLWHGIIGEAEADDQNIPPDQDNLRAREISNRSKNAKALHAIQLACGSENLSNIRKEKNARDAWNHLKFTFSEDSRAFPDTEQGSESQHIFKLHSYIKRGYWNDAKSFIERNTDAIFFTVPSSGRTVLHVAVASGRKAIVKELVSIGNRRLLRMQDKKGYTCLALAAKFTDDTEIAEWLIKKGGTEMLTIKTKDDDDGGGGAAYDKITKRKKDEDDNDDGNDKGKIPVVIAAAKGHKKMTKYLFSQTPIEVFFDNDGHYGLMLLRRCIDAEIFDLAAVLLQHRRNRTMNPLIRKPKDLRPIVYALAHMHSAFRSGTHLGWWRQFIYKCLRIPSHLDLDGTSIEIVLHVKYDKEPPNRNTVVANSHFWAIHVLWKIIIKVVVFWHLKLSWLPCKLLIKYVTDFLRILPGSEKMYEMKRNHYLVLEILGCLSRKMSSLDEPELHECLAYDTILHAAKHGIIEFIDSMRHANPDLMWAMDKNKRGIFSHAILNRQEKVFQLITKIEGHKEMIASRKDVFNNNMLHLAAALGPSSYLDSRSNAALQMQRELHWYKAVKDIVHPKCKEAKNVDGKKPRELFTKNHESLVKEGENWARDTARSFTIVGTLIITIMFAAAFSASGGRDSDTGVPTLLSLRKRAFKVFILADAISLITSSSSVLIFIWILTSRYAENDFFWKLPVKFLAGLLTLFVSVTSMMIAFGAALYMMLKGHRGIIMAVVSLAVVPVLVLIPTLLFLSFEIFISTWRSSLLPDKKG
ncbi:hypothetical protein HN51_067056 [Arachis hypogaea]|uniref:uncharacterized protein LOC107639816 isoform X1 n=1 Tax=Arachis ipaensis TaxID=130454 RepID=UPI0007AF6F4D|nr:uncharacterized protein LOC107639816 isoform X1 [Arachis ipaensis]XP_025649220.1 uncharacterized protein LOC112743987 isoform X1 [Arachis hypogaea]